MIFRHHFTIREQAESLAKKKTPNPKPQNIRPHPKDNWTRLHHML